MNKMPILEFVPHRPPMLLVDECLHYDEESVEVKVVINEGSLFVNKNLVPNYIAIEYMAQSVAIWQGKTVRSLGKAQNVGYLLGTRKLEMHIPYFKVGDELIVRCKKNYILDGLASFSCVVLREHVEVASAVISVYQDLK